ncbi:acyl-CoA dehydrogenase family protein [Nocardia bhagyanarayanae]|uniref:Alkylation response protein AidB-like acyl-CoA dehydrogenase n=1 Tax=Nocardia bhagyanarayanae TaxID=1215925 RepID=A0A543F841_9NOCA|nr:acyl-CoA dehydrogenase family protein [Nocardia bhagyanarayanae]TQM29920.1 alkylation response protein AidB-like acyl-CoA dehydrogenase [Nocardia bhagyanarayanae]
MDFTLTEEQQLLRDAVAGFLGVRYDLEKSRAAAKSAQGWQPAIWRGFAEELGILGATLPERVDGMGGGAAELMVIAEELGRALVVEPFVDTVVVGAGLLERSGGARADEVLRGIVAGDVRTAFASLEPTSGPTLHDVGTVARRDGDSWVLDGAKCVVTSAPLATHLLVTARTAGERRDRAGISLFLTEFDAANPPAGVEVHSYRTIDDRVGSDLTFTGFRLPADALLGAEGAAWDAIEPTVDVAIAAICAEAVGCLRRVLADTVEYAKQRQQFGVPIGSFQALQHRMVDMYMELEQAIAAAHLAAHALSAAPADRARALSAAKVTIGRAARFIGQNAVQLHGAMGMTEELAIGHYFKRLTALEREFGTTDHHRARYARLTRPSALSE